MPGAQSRGKRRQQGGRGGYRAGFSEDICPLTLLFLAGRTPAHSSFLWPWASFARVAFCLGALPLGLHGLHFLASMLAWDPQHFTMVVGHP